MKGYVYILTNKGMRGLVKIGMTTGSVEDRARDLSSTGVPFPFEIAFQTEVNDCAQVEKWLHNMFENRRVNKGREFFRVPVDKVIDAIKYNYPEVEDRIRREKVAEFEEQQAQNERDRQKARERETARKAQAAIEWEAGAKARRKAEIRESKPKNQHGQTMGEYLLARLLWTFCLIVAVAIFRSISG